MKYYRLTIIMILSAMLIAVASCRQESCAQVEKKKPIDKPAALNKPKPVADTAIQPASPDQPKPASIVSTSSKAPSTVVLVKVDDNIITQGDVDKETAQMKQMMKKRGVPDQQLDSMMIQFESQIIDGLVTRALLENEYAKNKIKITDDEVKKEIQQIEATLPKSMTIEMMLKQSGLTQSSFEHDVKEQLKIEKLLAIPEPTDEEIKEFYSENKEKYFEMPETVHARHILIATTELDDDKAKADKRKKAESIRKKLIKDADFEKLAEENSDCPSKNSGGDLGTFQRGRMVPAFEEVAFSLKTNEVSSVVQTRFGYHIIEALEHNQPKTLAFDDVKGRIAAMVKGNELQKKADVFINDLRGKATITYMHGAKPPAKMTGPAMMPVPASVPKAKTQKK